MNNKRTFKQLSSAEQEALHKLASAERALADGERTRMSLTFDSTCALARKLTDDSTLKASDEEAQVYTQLRLEGWIVVRHYDQNAKMSRFGVSDDYPQLQPA
jgi:hypothetical protein